MDFMDQVLIALIAVSLVSSVTGFLVGRVIERGAWNKLINQGRLPRPTNDEG